MGWIIVLLILAARGLSQENQADWPEAYNLRPYRHVYPPVRNVSKSVTSCTPDSLRNITCPLFIQLMMSFGGAFTSSGLVPGIQIALDQINAQQDLLPGYSLHYALLDSQCERTTSLNSLHSGLFNPPTKIAVVGAGCSTATEATAEISHYYNLVQVSCSSSSTELMNRQRFRNHFQVFPASISQAYGYFGIIYNSQWRRVSIIVEYESLFTSPINELKRLLKKFDIFYTEIIYKPGVDPFERDSESRIYVLSMYSTHARAVLCLAYKYRKDLRYPRNLFLINGNYHNNWWIGSEEEQERLLKEYNCDASQRASLIPRTLGIIISGLKVQNYSMKADNDYTGTEIEELYNVYLNASRLNVTYDFVYQLCYDSVWILAKALNKTMIDLENNDEFRSRLQSFIKDGSSDYGLHHFSYDNSVLTKNIFKHLANTNYKGIVGNISFNANGSRRVNTIDVNQYRDTGDGNGIVPVLVAKVHWKNDSDFNLTYLENTSVTWPSGIPYDGTITEQIVSVHLAVTIIFTVFGFGGIIFALVCISTSIYFRNKKVMRLSSPHLNILIGFGAIIMYGNMIVYVIPSLSSATEKWLCNVSSYLLSIGYSLCYGTIVAKMCRIYYIFTNPTSKKTPLKDWKLACFVVALIVIDIVILTVYLIFQSSMGLLNPSRIPSPERFEEHEGIYQETFHNYIFVCKFKNRYIIQGVLYGYKALLQVIALVLAISIRKVHIKELNDGKYTIPTIYTSSIVITVFIVSTYTISNFVNVYPVIICLCLFIGNTVVLGLVFLPPIMNVLLSTKNVTEIGINVDKKTSQSTGKALPSQ